MSQSEVEELLSAEIDKGFSDEDVRI